MPTFSLQCGPNADPNIRKVRNADPMPPLRTFLAALLAAHELVPNSKNPITFLFHLPNQALKSLEKLKLIKTDSIGGETFAYG